MRPSTKPPLGLAAGVVIWVAAAVTGNDTSAAEASFSRDVRPILSSRCFKCHGPDDANRESGLRLDVREAAIGKPDSGRPTIVPGSPETSELVRRIESQDESERMPPPSTNHTLTAQQIDTLKKWIAAGANYEPHWAFVAPRQTEPPAVNNADWPRNAIDHFVLAKLEQAGLKPSPEADRATLIRRVSLDLTGLPPTVEEVDAFLNDAAPDAYERLVDRLLASPRYGERWARRWLDMARYADTNGYEKDRPRSIWPYRDWVINALNADMPFDQFTIEQLAGDMLPEATAEQKIATGFHRNTMLNEEGGIDPQEFRFYSLVDRANTTATVWLGLTMGCAQCHTHKFDPLTHREYYQFLAFLDQAEEPDFDVPNPSIAKRRHELEARIAELTAALADKFPLADKADGDPQSRRMAADVAFGKWLQAEHARAVKWKVVWPRDLKANLARLTLLDDGSVLASGDATKRDVYEFELPVESPGRITAIRLELLPHESLPAGGPGRVYYEAEKGSALLSNFTLTAGDQKIALSAAKRTDGADSAAARAVDDDPITQWSIGGQGRANHAVFRLEKPLENAQSIRVEMVSEHYYAAALGRFRIWATDDSREIETSALPPELEDLCLLAPDKLDDQQRHKLKDYFLSVAPELAEARKEIDKLRGRLPKYTTTLVMQQRPADHRRTTHRQHRGEFLQPKEAVEPGVPAVLQPALESSDSKHLDRLTLARWLVDPRNPLVGRVTMNRHWAMIFGRGLVRTTEDFGYQGELPTHPELLDWLAVEFVRQNWSVKQMHRLLVTSATYRQSSQVNQALLNRDPENQLLARGPRFRLDAEQIRDQALAASGLLSPKLGGPSVFPPQPESVTSEGAYGVLKWKVSGGEDRYRRGLYTFSKRTAPFAMYNTFDAPSGEVCVGRREISNSPLQSLTLLNDEMFVEAAQSLGRQLAEHPGNVEDRMRLLFRRCLVRLPTEHELSKLVQFFETQLERFRAGELDAKQIASDGGNALERAAWTVTARSILNLDEMVTKE